MSDGAVADGDGGAFGQRPGGLAHDHGADEHHGAVRQLGARGLVVRPIRLNLYRQEHNQNLATYAN